MQDQEAGLWISVACKGGTVMDEFISKKALLRLVETMPSSPTTERENRLINAFITTVKNFPAADVRPVVRAEWLPFGKRGIYGMMYACSSCHAKYDGKTNFCPDCGAVMEES